MIYGFVGLPGTGKTLSMVNSVLPLVRKGVRVYTNTPIHVSLSKNQPVFLRNKDLLEALLFETNATFLIDEAQIVFDPYQWNRTDPIFLYKFSQGRKMNLDFIYTTQRFNHVLARLRQLTNYVIQCQRVVGNLFRNLWYDPEIYEKTHLFGTPMEQKFIRRRIFVWPWSVRKAQEAYNTNFLIEPFNAKDFSTILTKYQKDEFGNFVKREGVKTTIPNTETTIIRRINI